MACLFVPRLEPCYLTQSYTFDGALPALVPRLDSVILAFEVPKQFRNVFLLPTEVNKPSLCADEHIAGMREISSKYDTKVCKYFPIELLTMTHHTIDFGPRALQETNV